MVQNLEEFFRKLLFARQFKVSEGYLKIYDILTVMFPAEAFSAFVDSVIYSMGRKGKLTVYNQGINFGYIIAKNFQKYLKASGDSLMDTIFHIGGMGGWGVWKLYRKDDVKKEGIVHGWNIATAEFSYKQAEPHCHFLRGIIAGELRIIWKDDTIEVIETKCISQGNKFCEFIAKRRNNFDIKNKYVKNQLDLKT